MGQFSLDFKKFENKSLKNLDAIIRKTSLDLTTSIILDTAVDSGRARGSVLVSMDREDNTVTKHEDKSGQGAITKAKQELSKPIGRYIFIQSNLDYMVKLEYGLFVPKESAKVSGGFSTQSPQGIFRKNILRFNQFLNNSAKEISK